MARKISAGIDIGTAQIKAVIAEEVLSEGRIVPRIIGTGIAETRGVERGYIVDPAETARSVRQALTRAEKSAGEKVRRAYFSAGGVGLESISATGSVAITKADLEITERDIELAMESAEGSIPQETLMNRKIINSIPLEYKIDGKPSWGRVEGLKATKLEIKMLFLTAVDHHLEDVIKTAELAGIEPIDLVAGPVAASFVTLSKRQKKAGCVLVDIGAETLSMVVFENDNLTSLAVFPIGSSDITNDIALGLKVPLEEAEEIKVKGLGHASHPRKKYDEIISARLKDCFELVESHLKKIKRDGLLPAGIILTGGGVALDDTEDIAKEVLKLPAQVADIHFGSAGKGRAKEQIWATACGLSIVGFNADNEQTLVGDKPTDSLAGGANRLAKKLGRMVTKILP